MRQAQQAGQRFLAKLGATSITAARTLSDDGGMFVPAYTSPSQFEAYVHGQFGPVAAQVLAVYPHTTGRILAGGLLAPVSPCASVS